MERHNENLEMRFDCLAQVDEDDIDELAAGGSTSKQDNEVDKILTLCTWWQQLCTRYGSWLELPPVLLRKQIVGVCASWCLQHYASKTVLCTLQNYL